MLRASGAIAVARRSSIALLLCQVQTQLVLGALLDAEKASKKPVQLVRSQIAAKAAKLLFNSLVKIFEKLK